MQEGRCNQDIAGGQAGLHEVHGFQAQPPAATLRAQRSLRVHRDRRGEVVFFFLFFVLGGTDAFFFFTQMGWSAFGTKWVVGIGVLVGCFAGKIDGPGLPGVSIIIFCLVVGRTGLFAACCEEIWATPSKRNPSLRGGRSLFHKRQKKKTRTGLNTKWGFWCFYPNGLDGFWSQTGCWRFFFD